MLLPQSILVYVTYGQKLIPFPGENPAVVFKMGQSFTRENIHQRNIQTLEIELFQIEQNISTHMMNNIFHMRDNLRYNLRSQTKFLRSSANTTQYGLNSL